jgi:hypothetical protein
MPEKLKPGFRAPQETLKLNGVESVSIVLEWAFGIGVGD